MGTISIGGPYNPTGMTETPSRRKIFVCRPNTVQEEEPCARQILSTLARRAYRRPLTDQDIQTLLDFYQVGVKEGRVRRRNQTGLGKNPGWPRVFVSNGIRSGKRGSEYPLSYQRSGASLPPILLSLEQHTGRSASGPGRTRPAQGSCDTGAGGAAFNSATCARRLWRSISAGSGCSFVRLRSVSPDPDTFPYFDDNLREAFGQETELFLESLIREDRSILDLLNADHTFVNERLARHYGIPNIYGSHFRRVVLTEEHRRGLLGKGSILTVTSYANRTSPVLRGKWVLDHILGTPPAPPPPNIPDLVERDQDGKAFSMREALEQHRANPVCATCHSQMDPLGFALENFDGTGSWRTNDADAPIDASGILPDGTRFQGPVELQRVLIESKSEEFVNTVTEKLLTYALGRGVESYDAPAIRSIIREAAPDDYRWSSLILGIVKSTPFQMRRSWEQ